MFHFQKKNLAGLVMVFNATFNNISVTSWWSVLLVEELEYPEKPPSCHKTLTNLSLNVVSSTEYFEF